ncbi:MAG: MATE family efflux transporter, partial [Thermoanaerobaculia bacterium]|nr:MATE family efflux transporter [Thermoanaerobaculia bacterium]
MIDPSTSSDSGAARVRGPVRRIFLAILTIGSVTLFVKLVATGKELYVASLFGVSDALDAFLIAFMLPSFSIAVLGSAFQSAFVPAWVQARERDGVDTANRLTSNATALSAGMLVAFTLLLGFCFPLLEPLVASGFSPAKLELTRRLFYWLLPVIAAGGIASLWGSVLNAGERFVLVGLIPLATPVAVIGLLVARPETDPMILVSGTVAGSVIELMLLAITLRRHGIPVLPRWHGLDEPTRAVVRQYLPMVAGSLLMATTTVVDQSMAAMLGPGAVSALSYGNKIVGFVIGIAAVAIGTAVLPSFSAMVSRAEWSQVRRTLRFYSLVIAGCTVPLTIGLALFSEEIVRILFERGAFTAADTALVGAVQ